MMELFKDAETLAPAYLFSLACCDAGIPLMLIAPPAGGKTTIIFAIESFYRDKGEPVRLVSRIGLRGLRKLADWLNYHRNVVLLNEDYSLIGSSNYMVEKMAEIVSALSYSKVYIDEGLGVTVRVSRLGFITGVQPMWIRNIVENPVFATHIREKFVRYYVLPHKASRDISMSKAIALLVNGTKNLMERCKETYDVRFPKEFLEGLAVQVGFTRAREFADLLSVVLPRFIPREYINRFLKYTAVRLRFEESFISREVTETGFKVKTFWKGYTGLYWIIRDNKSSHESLRIRLGASSYRSVDKVLEETFKLGWVTSKVENGRKFFYIAKPIEKLIGW